MNFYFTGLQVDPEKLGLTPEARFRVEKVIATDGFIKSSIQKLGPIEHIRAEKRTASEAIWDLTYDDFWGL